MMGSSLSAESAAAVIEEAASGSTISGMPNGLGQARVRFAAHLQAMAEFFGILAGESRLALLEALQNGPLTVNELAAACAMKQPHVSQQLAILRHHRVVKCKREGVSIRYEVADVNILSCCRVAEDKIRQDAQRVATLMFRE